MHQIQRKPVEAIVNAIQALDLEPVIFRLSHPKGDKRWARGYAEHVAAEYRKFLTLLVKHADDKIVPSNEVDEFWHQHILDTMKYARDCEQVFGYFLHHYPYFGLEGEEDEQAQQRAAEKTHALYEREFDAPAASKQAAWCYAAVEARQPAWCYAAVEAKQSAWCYAAVEARQPAWCYAAVEARQSAWCYAAVKAKQPAWCYAAVEAKQPAWCYAAVETREPAWCYAAIEATAATPG
jgi:hypothetical protein